MRNFLILFLIGCASVAAHAQTPAQKIGYADWDYIFSQLPEYKQIETEMKTHGDQLQNQLQAKYKDYETKLKAYQAGAATMVDAIRRDKETELTQLQENIQKFQQDAQTSIQNKQDQLMGPVFNKVGKAIEDVAKEQGYSFILNPQLIGGGDILLYSDEKFDISDQVLKKMGVTPKPVADKTN
ncbi:MAG TPA: OmpH family outer membrane protein [Cyclobacteriaceae bacterium]|nr:OmpH family outer membrane protein [Cyclobacteriaceae bacterium]